MFVGHVVNKIIQQNQSSLASDILYTGCQNRTKFDTLMDLSLLNSGPYKTAELIDMPFGLRTWEGPGNHVLMGIQITPHGKGKFWRKVVTIYIIETVSRELCRKLLNRSRCRLAG